MTSYNEDARRGAGNGAEGQGVFVTQDGAQSPSTRPSRYGQSQRQPQQEEEEDQGDAFLGGEEELATMVAGVCQTTQSTLLLKKRKEMREVDDALDLMKQEYKGRLEKCEQRQREFEMRQKDMKDQVLRFEKFIQENDGKRARAEAKAKQERRLLEQKDAELSRLKQELHKARDEEEALKERTDRLKCFQDYLLDTITCSEQEWDEVGDLVNRFQTLKDANRDLVALCRNSDDDIERKRSEMQQYRRSGQNELLVRNSELNERQRELEQIRSAVIRANHESEKEAERVKGITRECGQVVLAIQNLHTRCTRTMRTKRTLTHTKDEHRLQALGRCLTLIYERISDLREIEAGVATGSTGMLPSNASSTQQQQQQQGGGGGEAGGSGWGSSGLGTKESTLGGEGVGWKKQQQQQQQQPA